MTTIALYARTSVDDAHPEAQIDRLRAYAERRGATVAEFVDRGASGAKRSRPALDALLRAARRREVDAVAVTKLDRLARSVRHLHELADELAAAGVDLVVLDQEINTASPAGRLLFTVLGAIAEFERDLIRERVREGIAAARRRGAVFGRPRALDRRGVERARRLRAAGRSLRYVARVLDVAPATVLRALR